LLVVVVALLALPACVTLPNGPDIAVIPGTGKTFEHFRDDDSICRQFGTHSIGGGRPDQAGSQSAIRSALTGAAVGAAAGVAFGGAQGAAIGAGSGLLLGSAAGGSANVYASAALQNRYDTAYMQCMYTKGNRVPVSGPLIAQPQTAAYPPPPPGYPMSRPRYAPPPPTR
jgi:hypothetical protein